MNQSFHTAQFKGPCQCLGNCWFSAFITICFSLGVRCSATPPGETYTNEDTTSNEHPPPSVLNYSAVPLPGPTQHPESQLKTKKQKKPAKTQAPQTYHPREPKQETCQCLPFCCSVFGGSSSEACLCVEKPVFVHYTVSCAII